jgi:hypothetical protein
MDLSLSLKVIQSSPFHLVYTVYTETEILKIIQNKRIELIFKLLFIIVCALNLNSPTFSNNGRNMEEDAQHISDFEPNGKSHSKSETKEVRRFITQT